MKFGFMKRVAGGSTDAIAGAIGGATIRASAVAVSQMREAKKVQKKRSEKRTMNQDLDK